MVNPTIWKEIYKQWERYINIITEKLYKILKNYPKTIYTGMIVCILISIACFIFLPRTLTTKQASPSALLSSFQSSINGLVSSATTAKEILELNAMAENILIKDSIGYHDSILVVELLERIKILEMSIVDQNKQKNIPPK